MIAGERAERRDERGKPTRKLRVQEVPGYDRVRRVRLGIEHGAPCRHRISFVRPQPREPEVKLHDGDARVELCELLEPVERPVGPRGEGGADLRLQGVVPRKQTPPRQRCHRSRRAPGPCVRSRASGSVRKPRANESGGRPSRGPAVVVCAVPAESPSEESTTPATTATAAAATAATNSTMRRRGDTAGR